MHSGNYISNLSLTDSNGGWNGMNAAMHRELIQRFQLNYVGPVNPPSGPLERLSSKLFRLLHRPGDYHFFSDSRLNRIARLVRNKSQPDAVFDYFHGITPWIRISKRRPTFAFADACFATYFNTYHQHDRFCCKDLDRISGQEKFWLQEMDAVFFTSQYAIDECCRRYSIKGDNFQYVGMGAGVDAPECDTYSGGHKLLFIAVDFARKGGEVCVAAYQKFRQSFADATLTLIGAQPPQNVLDVPGVSWAGFLRKENPEHLRQLQQHLASAFALILPTVSDMTPVVLAEAGIYGCPTLAPRSFGIPEMIEDRYTGRLLAAPPQADQFAQALVDMASRYADYMQMRKAARTQTMEKFTWKRVADRVSGEILSKLHLKVA